MKNKLLLGTLLIFSIASLFTSCKDDRDDNPTFRTPTEFKVNTPAMTDQYIQLSEDNTVHLTWSQPNYGYNAQATYSIQVGVVQDDGSIKWSQKTIKDDDGNVIGYEDDFMISTYTTCSANISAEGMAMEINQADGVKEIEQYVDKGFRKIAVRVKAALIESNTTEVPGSTIISEPVFFNHMRSFRVIKKPAFIYLIGTPGEWLAPIPANAAALEEWKLEETEIGNKNFEGTFDLPAGELSFRFYEKLTDWGGGDSWGADVPDLNNVACELKDGAFDFKPVVKGQSNWKFESIPAGSYTITFNMKDLSLRIVAN